MDPVVITIRDEWENSCLDQGLLGLPREQLGAFADILNQTVIFQRVYGPDQGYFAFGVLSHIGAENDGLVLRFGQLQFFAATIKPESGIPAITSQSELQEPFDLGAALGVLQEEEIDAEFARERNDHQWQSFSDKVLIAYANRCVFTRQAQDCQALMIQPSSLGGQYHVANGLSALPIVARAFRAGHISIGPEGDVLVMVSRIPAELLRLLSNYGKILAPLDPSAAPMQGLLAWHRQNLFASEKD